MEEIELAARALLNEWADGDLGITPNAGDGIVLRSVEEVGPTRVNLRTRFERRTLELRRESTNAPLRDSAHPDVWSIAVPDSSAERETIDLEAYDAVVVCTECNGSAEASCAACGGGGYTGSDAGGLNDAPSKCALCLGTGLSTCWLCHGAKQLRIVPRLVIERGVELTMRTVEEAEELPLPVLLVVQEEKVQGKVIAQASGERLEAGDVRLEREGGPYRGGGARLSSRIESAVEDLVNAPVPESTRITGQELEVVRVPVYLVRPKRGRVFWVMGTSPPTVLPPGILRGSSPLIVYVAAIMTVMAIAAGLAALLR